MGDIWPYGPPRYVTWDQARKAAENAGFSQDDAAVMAAIGTAESSLDLSVVNDTPSTGDYSVGVWQINYYGSLWAGRRKEFGKPGHLVRAGLQAQANAAFTIWIEQFFNAWSTYNSGAYKKYLHGALNPPSNPGTSPGTPHPPATTAGDDWSKSVTDTAAKFAVGSAAFDRHIRTLEQLIR